MTALGVLEILTHAPFDARPLPILGCNCNGIVSLVEYVGATY